MIMDSEIINKQLRELINEPEDSEEYADRPLGNEAVNAAWNFLEFIQPLDIHSYVMFRYNGFVVLQWDTSAFKIVGDRTIVEWGTQRRYDLTTPEQMLDILNLNTKG
jgi:hypothetical protein